MTNLSHKVFVCHFVTLPSQPHLGLLSRFVSCQYSLVCIFQYLIMQSYNMGSYALFIALIITILRQFISFYNRIVFYLYIYHICLSILPSMNLGYFQLLVCTNEAAINIHVEYAHGYMLSSSQINTSSGMAESYVTFYETIKLFF